MEINLTHLLKSGESGLGLIKSFSTPLDIAKTASGIASNFSYTAGFSKKADKRLYFASGPSEVAALAIDALALSRCGLSSETAKLGLSLFKRSCDSIKWLERFQFIAIASPSLGHVEGVGLLSDVMSASLRLWQEWGPNPPKDKDFIISIPNFLKASLLFYVYLTDNKKVKIVATVVGMMGDGYSFYKRSRTFSFDYRNISLSPTQACQIITSIALACLGFCVLEKVMPCS